MLAEKVDPPAQKLAGKRAGRPVMRNETDRISPVLGDSIGRRPKKFRGLDGCTSTKDMHPLPQMVEADIVPRELIQRREALIRANDVRFDRARVRRQLSSGELDFETFLDEMPSSCASVPVVKVLRWIPNIGRPKAMKFLAAIRVELAIDVNGDTLMGELPKGRATYMLAEMVQREVEAHKRRWAA